MVRISGRGLVGIVAQARSEVGIESVTFATAGGPPGPRPFAGLENTLRVSVRGGSSNVTAALVAGALDKRITVALTADRDGVLLGRVTPPAYPFRVPISGVGDDGQAWQRMSPALLTPPR